MQVSTTEKTLIVFFTTIISTGICTKCFQCNSAEDPGCVNVKSNDTGSPFYKECTGIYDGKVPFCRKFAFTILGEKEETRVVRSCGWIMEFGDERRDRCKKGDTDFILKRSCQCFQEGCNYGLYLKPSFLLLLFSCLANYLNQ